MDSRSFRDGSSDQEPYHFEQKTTLNKTLILESNCHPSQQYSVKIPYNFVTRQLDLGQTLYQIFQQIIPPEHLYQVFYYCSQSEYFVFGGMYPFQDYLYLNEEFGSYAVITVKIIRVHPPLTEQTETVNKKKRVNDRILRQILQKVAQWRNISQIKNITLQQAAKYIGLPKKTLDDYFYQIKQGQYYGFNFEQHQNQRIGVLRRFVKENHKKKPQQPIKILQQFMENAQICGNHEQDSPDSEEEEE